MSEILSPLQEMLRSLTLCLLPCMAGSWLFIRHRGGAAEPCSAPGWVPRPPSAASPGWQGVLVPLPTGRTLITLTAGFSCMETFLGQLKRQKPGEQPGFGPNLLQFLLESADLCRLEPPRHGRAGEAAPAASPQRPRQGLGQQSVGRLLEEHQRKTPRRSVSPKGFESCAGGNEASGLRSL